MNVRWNDPSRGVTLIELMITLTLGLIVIAGALALLVGQQAAFRAGTGDRAQQETARVALESVTSNLRMAGYGIDPAVAFDFGPQASIRMARAPEGSVVAATSFKCNSAVSCRDSTTGPDEIVFLARDPGFGYPLAQGYASGSSQLVLTGPLRNPIHRGQILQVMCFTGSMRWAYVTVGAEVPADAGATVAVPLVTGTTAFPNQTSLLNGDGCFGSAAPTGSSAAVVAGAAKVFKVDRFRYFVQSFVEADGTHPYLMLDQGLFDASGNAIVDVVAPDVEDLQFSYVFPASTDPSLRLVGASSGNAITASSSGIDTAPSQGPPSFDDVSTSPQRTTQHPGNIRVVRMAVVVRTPTSDPNLLTDGAATVPAAGNRASFQGPTGYRRTLFETSSAIRNLDARAPYFPTYTADAPNYSTRTDQLNVGGG
jgi:type IV pilus assembly protein PilW